MFCRSWHANTRKNCLCSGRQDQTRIDGRVVRVKAETVSYVRRGIPLQAREIDDLWDRLSRAYALVRQESPAEMIQDEMEQLRAMLDERHNSRRAAKALQAALQGLRSALSSVCGL